jgi:hypothetical protein
VRCGSSCGRRDLVGGWTGALLWYLPAALVVAGISLPAARAALWIPSFTVMGVACVVNARRCGRLHCFVTGPVFLSAAIASTIDALSLVRIDWRIVVLGAAIGTLIAYALEWAQGKYIAVPSTRE